MTRSNTADNCNIMDNMFSAFSPRKRIFTLPPFSCLSASSTGVTRFSLLLLPELAQRAVLTDFIFSLLRAADSKEYILMQEKCHVLLDFISSGYRD